MNVLCCSVTEAGRRLARRLPYRHDHGRPAAAVHDHWHDVDAFVLVLAVGAAMRIVAPLLQGKDRDPAVVCVDDAARYAVSLCGGHHGANQLAREVASLLGAHPVITTATDAAGLPSLDELPGWHAEGDVAAVTASLVDGEHVTLDNRAGWPLPPGLHQLVARGVARRGVSSRRARIVVSDRNDVSEAARQAPATGTLPDRAEPDGPPPARSPTVVLRPPSLVVGVGTSSTATAAQLCGHVDAVLSAHDLSTGSVCAVATIDRRAQHPAVVALGERLGVPVTHHDAECLRGVAVPSPSAAVERAVATASVAEAAALLAAGRGATLIASKSVGPSVTTAVARRPAPLGAVTVVGLGPGASRQRTHDAERAVRHAEVVIGYRGYLDLCADLLQTWQEVIGFALGAELERARLALERAAAGQTVALVCSGDPGVYAMASPLIEMAHEHPDLAQVDVEVVPGVTASSAAAALLGAPLGHDHAVLSLSDLHTPWSSIRERVVAAAKTDLVLVLYNPRSRRRGWQLREVQQTLLGFRPPETPVGIVRKAGRANQRVRLTTLGELPVPEVDMASCVVIGCSTTRVLEGRMVTPRGYPYG